MKLTQLQYYIAACQHNNITAAAKDLHISQPSISNAIRDLEQEFGVKLISRTNKILSRTQEGEYFYRRASDLVAQLELLERQMCDFGTQKNNVRIGIPPMIGAILYPPMLQAFKENYPNINLDVSEEGSVETIRLVAENNLDVALVVTDTLDNDHMNVIPLCEAEVYFCVNKQNPLACETSISMEMIRDEPIVMYRDGYYLRKLILDRYSQIGITPRIVLNSNQLYTSKNMVLTGLASAFLFQKVVEYEDDIIGIPLAQPIKLHIGLIWKKSQYLYSDVTKFIDFAKEYV